MSLFRSLALGVAFIAALPAAPVTIIARTNSGDALPGNFGGSAVYVSWTQTGTFSNVTIQANLSSSSGTATGNAYLTTQVGAGATVAQQVATTSISTSNPASSGVSTPLFSGLTLGPGTYYLVVSGVNLGFGTSASSVTVVGTGVTANPDAAVFSAAAPFPPASTFFNKGQGVLFSAISNAGASTSLPPATGVPALSPFALLATALLLLASGLGLLKFYRPQE